jgi:hypothetical protein
MDQLDQLRTAIRAILTGHTRVPFAYGDLRCETVFDPESDRYVLLIVGRDHDGRRVDAPLIHVDIIDGKAWVQCDGTEYGVARELMDAGIPKDRIVLGFLSPELRQHTEFAVA